MYRLGRRVKTIHWVKVLAVTLVQAMIILSAVWSWAGTDTLNVALPYEPVSLDPHKSDEDWSLSLIFPCYQRLTSLKPSGVKVEPSLALTWRISDDGLAYTFVIKQDRTFADGRNLDADAVLKSFQHVMSPGHLGRIYFPTLYKIQLLGPYTIRFHLNRPAPFFLQALATGAGSIVSPAVLEHAPGYLDRNTAGSGLYQLEGWEPGRQIVLKARDTSPSGPSIKKLIAIFEPSSERQLSMLQAGRLHLATGLGPSELEALKYQPPLKTYQVATYEICFLALNCRRPWLAQQAARQALAGAVDYQGLVELSWGDDAMAAAGPLPSGMWGGFDENISLAYSPEQAEKKLSEVGLPKAPLSLVYLNTAEWQANTAGLIKTYLEVLNIPLTLEPQTDRDYQKRAVTGDFDLLLGARQPFIPHPYPLLESWFSYTPSPDLNSNVAFYRNGEVEELLERIPLINDPNAELPLYHRIQEITAEDTPYLYLTQFLRAYGLAPEVQGFSPHPAQSYVIPLSSMKLAPGDVSHP